MYANAVERIQARLVVRPPFESATGEESAHCEVVEAVINANAEFYASLQAGSMERLSAICCPSQASVIHPARRLIAGWTGVSRSWQEIFSVAFDSQDGHGEADTTSLLDIYLKPDSVRVHVPPGSGVAWVTATEVFGGVPLCILVARLICFTLQLNCAFL